MNEKVYDEIVNIIAEILEEDSSRISGDTAIGDLESWDSLHHLQIIARIERTYGFKFTPDIMIDLEDVGDIVKATEDRIG